MSDYYDGYMEEEFDANEESVTPSTPQFYKSKGATRPSNLPPPAPNNKKNSSQKAHSPQNEDMSWVSISLIVVGSLVVCALGFAAYKHFTKGKN